MKKGANLTQNGLQGSFSLRLVRSAEQLLQLLRQEVIVLLCLVLLHHNNSLQGPILRGSSSLETELTRSLVYMLNV